MTNKYISLSGRLYGPVSDRQLKLLRREQERDHATSLLGGHGSLPYTGGIADWTELEEGKDFRLEIDAPFGKRAVPIARQSEEDDEKLWNEVFAVHSNWVQDEELPFSELYDMLRSRFTIKRKP